MWRLGSQNSLRLGEMLKNSLINRKFFLEFRIIPRDFEYFLDDVASEGFISLFSGQEVLMGPHENG